MSARDRSRPDIPSVMPSGSTAGKDYQLSMSSELKRYERCTNVHDLPDIFHYWSNRHILPKLLARGFSSPDDMFLQSLAKQLALAPGRTNRFVSLGCGNGDLEIKLAKQIRQLGGTDFVLDCLDVNPAMLDRGTAQAAEAGLGGNVNFIRADLNEWDPQTEYNAALAHQSLHHVVNLEHLFTRTRDCLHPDGSFIISDMIGRNGHQRWPEALEIIHEFWRRIPPSFRFNQLYRRYEDLYENYDCSWEGFEGIRSQDILPLLLEYFHFDVFIAYGNVIDPFVDRAFGPNFDSTRQWDRKFIDAVHTRDEAGMAAGSLTPTHMLGVLRKPGGEESSAQTAARLSVRLPDREPAVARQVSTATSLPADAALPEGPHGVAGELAIACERLQEASERIRHFMFGDRISETTQWALSLDRQVEALRLRIGALEQEIAERTAWALRLDKELAEQTPWASGLDRELEERTAWAMRLERQLEEQTRLTARLQKEISGYLRNPVRLAPRIAAAVRYRLTQNKR